MYFQHLLKKLHFINMSDKIGKLKKSRRVGEINVKTDLRSLRHGKSNMNNMHAMDATGAVYIHCRPQ